MYRQRKLLSIFIIEDNVQILNEIKIKIVRQLQQEVQILTAKTFKEAKEVIKQGLFDIAIVDLFLPDGHGEDLIKLIRQNFKYLPIIVQTTEKDTAYQAMLHNKFGQLIYLTKSNLYEELDDSLVLAKNMHKEFGTLRLSIKNNKSIELININEICYIFKISGVEHLHVELYNYEKEDYESIVIEYMSLVTFMSLYNETNHFLRCHNSYIVNKKMIKSYSLTYKELTMLMPRKSGTEVKISVSETYRKQVREALKGVMLI